MYYIKTTSKNCGMVTIGVLIKKKKRKKKKKEEGKKPQTMGREIRRRGGLGH